MCVCLIDSVIVQNERTVFPRWKRASLLTPFVKYMQCYDTICDAVDVYVCVVSLSLQCHFDLIPPVRHDNEISHGSSTVNTPSQRHSRNHTQHDLIRWPQNPPSQGSAVRTDVTLDQSVINIWLFPLAVVFLVLETPQMCFRLILCPYFIDFKVDLKEMFNRIFMLLCSRSLQGMSTSKAQKVARRKEINIYIYI